MMHSRTVSVLLMGRLGNQLFQYAIGRAVAERYHRRLLLDLTWLEHHNTPYRLAPFHIRADFVNSKEQAGCIATLYNNCLRLMDVERPERFPFARLYTYCLRKIGIEMYINEQGSSHITYPFNTKSRRLYLYGYWQNEEYFSDCADLIRDHLQVKVLPNKQARQLMDEVKNDCSVSVHVRRGDYVGSTYHPVLPLTYYQSAAQHIDQQCSSKPKFYVSTDDPDWVIQHFHLDYDWKLISSTGSSVLDDMRVMQECEHHIIANSSFSWWAAWLSSSPNKIVVAPRLWFFPKVGKDAQLPTRWLRI